MAVMIVAGCSGQTVGVVPPEPQIVTGRTTKIEVLEVLGQPDKKYATGSLKLLVGGHEYRLQDPLETWLYYSSGLSLFDLFEMKTTRVVFDPSGIVTSYTY